MIDYLVELYRYNRDLKKIMIRFDDLDIMSES